MHIRYELFPQREGATVRGLAFSPRDAIVALHISANGPRLVCCTYTSTADPPSFVLGPLFAEHKVEALAAMAWSFGGQQLFAVAGKTLSTFALSAHLGSPALNKTRYLEDQAEILCIAPGRDDAELFYGTLDGRVVKLRRNVAVAQRQFDNKVIALLSDPLRRYLGALTLENVFAVCDFQTLQPERGVDLALRAGEGPARAQLVLREDRKIDLSPDLQTVLLPSLEDKRLPLALGLAPARGFAVECVFGGSFAPITVVRFLPAVLLRDEQPFCVFAMGDAHGNIAFWELTGAEKPLFLLKSDDFNVTIENIDFSPDATVMLAATNRRFFITALLTPGAFGAAAWTPRAEFMREVLENDIGDFRPVTYRELRERTQRPEPAGPIAPRRVAFRKRAAAEPRAEPASPPAERPAEPQPGRHFFARPKAMEDAVVPLAAGHLALTNREGKGALRLIQGGSQVWKAGGFGSVTRLACAEELVLLADERDYIFFLDRATGIRCRQRLLFDSLYELCVSPRGVACLVNTRGEFMLHDVQGRRAGTSGSLEGLLLAALREFGSDARPEAVLGPSALRLAMNSADELTVLLLDAFYVFKPELRAWAVGCPFGPGPPAPALGEWRDAAEFLLARLTANPRRCLGDLEEAMLAAAEADSPAAFSEAMKEYFVNLAQTGEYERLKAYLLQRVLIGEESAERRFLRRAGVAPASVIRNALALVKHFDNSADFVRFFDTFLAHNDC